MRIPGAALLDDWQDWAAKVVAFFDSVTIPDSLQTGAIMNFKDVVQTGYLLCNGSTFPAATYPALAQFLGGTILPNLTSPYGAGYVVGIKT